MEIKEIILKSDAKTIEKILYERGFSKKRISALKYQGGTILVNGEPQKVTYVLKEGEVLYIKEQDEIINPNYPPYIYPLEIIYEDNYIIIINKEANIETIPSRRNNEKTIGNALKAYYQDKGINANCHFINRLDKDTSGLLLVAKSGYVHHLFKDIKIEKKYLAIVQGNISDGLVIEANIKKAEGMKRMVALDGEYAKTGIKPVAYYDDFSLIEVILYTGRTHQIRVHLESINHPLLGDKLYNPLCQRFHRQALHSYYLKFFHPLLNQELTFTCVLPHDMRQILNKKT